MCFLHFQGTDHNCGPGLVRLGEGRHPGAAEGADAAQEEDRATGRIVWQFPENAKLYFGGKFEIDSTIALSGKLPHSVLAGNLKLMQYYSPFPENFISRDI